MIVAAEATGRLLARLDQCTDALARLARTHASTLMAGRTLGQVAAPTTFGLKATGWLAGVDAAGRRLRDSRARLAIQLGGPVGTGAAWSPSLPALLSAFAQATGLASTVPWHTERSRVVELATSLGQAVAACAKIATDVIALSQNEIGELREGAEPGRGGSSAMPHKQNPVGSVLVRAAALRSPGLVATVLSAAVHEGERATGAWHAEWAPLRELLHLAGGAGALTADVLERLEVDEPRMADRVTGAGSVMFAESVSRALSGPLGRAEAQEVVAAAAHSTRRTGTPFHDVLAADPRVTAHLDAAALESCFDPGAHVRAAADLVALTLSRRDTPEDR
jgi:3-carboxy-cis,cis-muconate cycloisomerase